jgi:hypothetical protein
VAKGGAMPANKVVSQKKAGKWCHTQLHRISDRGAVQFVGQCSAFSEAFMCTPAA